MRQKSKWHKFRRTTAIVLAVVRWGARIVAGLLAALVALIVIAHALGEEGLPNPFEQPHGAAFELLGLFVSWTGLIVAWKWEGIGAAMILGGMLVFHIVEGKLLLLWTFTVFDLVGILFLLCWGSTRLRKT